MIKSLEGSRGLAAVFVTLYHLGIAWYIKPVAYGYLFVDLFFVLSGFVISIAYSSRISTLEDLKFFLIRRFGRLFPLTVFSTVIFVIVFNLSVWAKRSAVAMGYVWVMRNPDAVSYMVPSLGEVSATTLFLQGMGLFNTPVLNYVSWSISVEFYTYLLFATVCIALAGRARIAAWVALSAAGLAITAWASIDVHGCVSQGHCNSITSDFGFARCVGSFFLGAIAFHLSRAIRFNAGALQLITVVGVILFFSFVSSHPLLAFAFPFLCSVAVISLCSDREWLANLLHGSFFQMIGQRSFSIYMLHPIVLLFFAPGAAVIGRISNPVLGFVCTAVIIAIYLAAIVWVSGWTYARIEAPCRDWFNRLVSRKSVDAPAPPAPAP